MNRLGQNERWIKVFQRHRHVLKKHRHTISTTKRTTSMTKKMTTIDLYQHYDVEKHQSSSTTGRHQIHLLYNCMYLFRFSLTRDKQYP